MDADLLFQVTSALVLPGWALLLFAPGWRFGTRVLVPLALPAALAVVYTVLVASSLPGSQGGLGSLDDVRVAFADDRLLLAGWVHYLAFDLFVGGWEVRDARERGLPHLLVVPCLIGTFLLGPVGLLAYLALRTARARRPARA